MFDQRGESSDPYTYARNILYIMYLMYIVYIVYIGSMNGKVSKQQLAVAVLKGKKVELQWVLDNASGGGSWRRIIITRIGSIETEIKELEGKGAINAVHNSRV